MHINHPPRASRLVGLLLCIAVVTALLPTAAASAQDDFDKQLVELANQWRAEQGLDRLISHPGLSTRSLQWSEYLASGITAGAECDGAGSNWGHSDLSDRGDTDPPGTTKAAENITHTCTPPGQFAKTWPTAAGPLPGYCTSPIDYASAAATMCRWLASPGHRAQLADPALTHIGSGTATAQRGVFTEQWSTHSFTRSTVPRLDPNCDGLLDIRDALAIAQFSVQTRTGVNSCALTSRLGQINVAKSDFNGDGIVNILDAFGAAQCVVGVAICD